MTLERPVFRSCFTVRSLRFSFTCVSSSQFSVRSSLVHPVRSWQFAVRGSPSSSPFVLHSLQFSIQFSVHALQFAVRGFSSLARPGLSSQFSVPSSQFPCASSSQFSVCSWQFAVRGPPSSFSFMFCSLQFSVRGSPSLARPILSSRFSAIVLPCDSRFVPRCKCNTHVHWETTWRASFGEASLWSSSLTVSIKLANMN